VAYRYEQVRLKCADLHADELALVDVIVDAGISGKPLERPGLHREGMVACSGRELTAAAVSRMVAPEAAASRPS
jgi:hypothetical protein